MKTRLTSMPVGKGIIDDRERNFVVDGWLRTVGWWDESSGSLVVSRYAASPQRVAEATKAGTAKTVRKAYRHLVDIGEMEVRENEVRLLTKTDPPYVRCDTGALQAACALMCDRQLRELLVLTHLWQAMDGTFSAGQVLERIGWSPCNVNKERLSDDVGRLAENGWLTVKPAGRLRRVTDAGLLVNGKRMVHDRCTPR